ncbi:MAG: UvrD-helicase domain-containing protein, partial [Pseudomonadota bacterium]
PDAAAFLETEQGVYLGADERLRSIAAYGDSAALMRFAASGLARYAQLKTASGRLDFDDMIEAVRRLLGSGAGAAWVLYKLDGGLSHILVDEAQDTSPDQWAVILKPLDEFFAGAGARAEREKGPRTVFAVGDEKQSIYSFQGADVAQFSATQDELARRVTAAGLQFHPKELLLSFRSAPPVLSAVDAMFADEARARCITTGASYTGGGPIVQHKAHRLGAAGLVELWPALEPAERSQSRVWDAPLDQEGEASPRRALAARIARTIAGWLASGEELVSKGRPIAPGDVMILVRRRNVFFEQMIRELKLHDVPVAGADRLKLTEDIAVMDLLSLARFSLAPGDDLSLAEALKSPLFGFDDDGLFKLAYGRKGSLWRAVQDRRGDHAEAAAVLAACVAHAGRAGPFAFFSDVLRTAQNGVSGRRRIYERLGLPAREALDELLNIALQYEAAHPPTLQGFVDWMERRETVLKRDHDREGGAVQVMTVHGAKGLEAEIVFLPDTCQTPQAGRWPFFQLASGALVASQTGERPAAVVKDLKAEKNDQQMEEYLRLLYVAATRARDRLYICGYKHMNSAGRPTIGKDSWYAIAEETLPPLMEEATGPDGETVWRLSSPQTAEIETKDGPVRAEVPPPPDWLFRPAPPARAPAARLAPSRAGKSAKPCAVLSPLAAMAPGLSPLARGRLIHKLLEVLPETAPDERRARALAFLARPSAAPAETRAAELEALADETLAVLADPAFAPVFAPGSRAEVPIIGASPSGAEVFGQVDRLTVEADRVLIADFKTDRPPPTSAEDADPAYVAQMALYRHVLAGVYPGREVACALVFTLGPRLISLPSAVLDGALSRL